MDASRIELAEAFLREAVYRSRAKQGLIATLSPRQDPDAPGACGLGKHAAVELGLDEKGTQLFDRLFASALAENALERVRTAMTDWVTRQDALDRKRNHFMKAFRHEHGFDRSAYSEDEARAYEEGLAAVNDEVNRDLRAAAEALVALG